MQYHLVVDEVVFYMIHSQVRYKGVAVVILTLDMQNYLRSQSIIMHAIDQISWIILFLASEQLKHCWINILW